MHTREPESTLEGLDDRCLRARLAREDWQNDALFVPDEQVFRMFQRARASGNKSRVALLSEVFSRRLLQRSRKFALKSKIFPGLIDDLKRASHEIASELWEHLATSDKDALHAQKAFGQLFERRALSFQRKLLAKKRTMQVNIEALEGDVDDDSGWSTLDDIEALQEHESPEILAARRQQFQQANGRLQEILTPNEYTTYVLLNAADWQIQEIAASLDVTVKTVNNYKNRALEKIEKEFKQ